MSQRLSWRTKAYNNGWYLEYKALMLNYYNVLYEKLINHFFISNFTSPSSIISQEHHTHLKNDNLRHHHQYLEVDLLLMYVQKGQKKKIFRPQKSFLDLMTLISINGEMNIHMSTHEWNLNHFETTTSN